MPAPSICDEELLQLVKLVYEAAEDAALWQKFLERVSALMKAAIGTMEVYDGRQRTGQVEVSINLEPDCVGQYAAHYASMNPWQEGGRSRFPMAKAVTGSMYVPDEVLYRSEFYQDFLKHVGAFHLAGGVLQDSKEQNASISFFRPRLDAAFDPRELALLDVLLPHIKQALHLHHRIGIVEGERRAIAEALDRIPIGVVVVDDYARVLSTNREGAEILAKRDGLSSGRGGLQAAVPSQTTAFRKLVALAATTSRGSGFHPGGVLRLERPSLKEPLSVRVIPLSTQACLAQKVQAAAVVFLTDPSSRTSVSHLALLYGLTPAEERLTTKLIEGQTLDEIAAALRISRNTAATQLKSVFLKTSTRRQAELVRLLLRSVAALAP